jgi:virginiamycin B lyase
MLTLPPDHLHRITAYLATHFLPRPAPAAVMIAGPVHVTMTEWLAPTLGSRPHDLLAAANGSIWWTGQFANRLGRVDPRSGARQEYPLKTPGSGPHGLVEDNAGHIWFTMQSGHVGLLSPATGEMQIVAAPSGAGNTYPYGIQVNAQGVPWYVDFRGNRIASIEPRTMAIKEIALPSADARPRRIAITADDAVWHTDFARGSIGRYDPQTGALREWLSPGGKDSQPYGIASVGDIVWYSESGVRPSALVRFDPAAEEERKSQIPPVLTQ